MLNISGCYEIVNTTNGHRYIGSSVDIKARWRAHLSALRSGSHRSTYLQRAWDKYGEAAFIFKPLLYCDLKMTLLYEQILLDGLKPEYNIATCAEASARGLTHSDEARAKNRAAHLGKNLGNTYAAHKHTDAQNEAKSARMMGNTYSTGNKGSTHSAAQNDANSLLMMGNTRGTGNKGKTRTAAMNKANSARMTKWWEEQRAHV